MKKAPAFQFYPSDFLSDEHVALMTNQEVGCYIKLLCYCWKEGSIPKDTLKLSKLCGESDEKMGSMWPNIRPCFRLNGERYFHKRLDAERRKQKEWRKKSVKGGRHSARTRKDLRKGGSTEDSKGGSTLQSSSSSSITPIAPNDKTTKKEKLFDLFWKNYPRREGKGAARKAWAKIKDPVSVIEKIKQVLPTQMNSKQWTKDNGDFIPHPATYINQERWEDEINE